MEDYADDIYLMKEEILRLKRENITLVSSLTKLTEAVEKLGNQLTYNINVTASNALRLQNLPYEIMDPEFVRNIFYPHIMSNAETLDLITEHHKSIARFGDGEFAAIACTQRWKFQKADIKLAERLEEVLQSEEKNLVVGLLEFYGAMFLSEDQENANAVRKYLTPEVRKQHLKLLSPLRLYGNTDVFAVKSMERAHAVQKIWENRDCVIIEGEKTRFGVGNDLMKGAASVKRILCPSRSAFDRYEEILACARDQEKNAVILISLGPTATVLAYDLTRDGYQAIDIGHCDIFYEAYCRSESQNETIGCSNLRFKDYIAGGGELEDIEDARDEQYELEIIADISK